MELDEVVTSVEEMIKTSEREVENADYGEIGKYLAVTMTKEKIDEDSLLALLVPYWPLLALYLLLTSSLLVPYWPATSSLLAPY